MKIIAVNISMFNLFRNLLLYSAIFGGTVLVFGGGLFAGGACAVRAFVFESDDGTGSDLARGRLSVGNIMVP